MTLYRYHSRPIGKTEWTAAVGLLTAGMLAFSLSLLPALSFRLLYRLLAILLLVGFGGVVYRYFLRSYRYELVRREDGSLDPDFVITELFGNRVRVVCRVSLADLCEIVPISSQKNKKENGGAVFCYTARMGRQDAYRMTLRDGEETVSVIFESDRRLFELLSQK